MLCKEIRENLFNYSGHELPHDIRKSFEQHLQTCSACSDLVSEFISLESIVGKEKTRKPNPFAATRILQFLDSENGSQKYHHHHRTLRLLQPALITFSLILALLAGFMIGRHGGLKARVKTAGNSQVETLKSDLYIPDFIDEEKTFITNK